MLALVLIFLQEIVFRAYWPNYIGLATQLFYMPLGRLSFLLSFVLPLNSFALTSAVSLILLLGVSYFGRVSAE